MYQTAARLRHEPPSTQPPPAPGHNLEAAATLAARSSVGGETAGADGKAAGVLTLLSIMYMVLGRFGPELKGVLHQGGPARVICGLLLLGFATMALCAVVQAFRTIVPRFCKAKPSLAFFGEIARLSREEYFERVESMTMRDALDHILSYNHTAATICVEKYKQLRRSLRSFEIAAACWLMLCEVLVLRSIFA